MHYQLFLPLETKPAVDAAQARFDDHMRVHGLDDHVDDANHVNIVEGPDGKPGVLVGWLNSRSKTTRLEFKPAEQTWIQSVPIDGFERYWVGIWNDPPRS